MAEQCHECGASGRWGSCEALFLSLLALDHERRQPWGRWHTLNVACYLLQHPSQANKATLAAQWGMVQEFLLGGLDAVHARAQRAVRQNSRRVRHQEAADISLPALVEPPEVTIEYVSVDGSFPAEGYEGRMETWIRDVAAGRGASS